jgi:hypothetical protein
MSEMDRQFRVAALVITYISTALLGILTLILISASIINYSYTNKIY